MRRRIANESGFVMVAAIAVMAFTMLVAGVAVTATVLNRGQSTVQERAERAQQGADAGVQAMLYRLNQLVATGTISLYQSSLTPLTNLISCLGLSATVTVQPIAFVGITPPANCPGSPGNPRTTPVTENLGNHTTVSTVVKPITVASNAHAYTSRYVIVSTATEDNGTASTSDDIIRRVAAYTTTVEPFEAVEGVHNVTINTGTLGAINGDLRANNDLTISGLLGVNANVGSLLGGGSVSPIFQYGGNHTAPLVSLLATWQNISTTPFTRPPISVLASKPTCSAGAPCPAAINAQGMLTVSGSSTVNLGPGDYVLCGISVASGANLVTATGASTPTRIYIDSPTSARCSGVSGAGNIAISGGLNPGVNVAPSQTQLYVVGNGTPNGTTVSIGTGILGGLTSAFFLYAPTSNVTLKTVAFTGSAIGYDVTINPGLSILGIALANVISQNLGLTNQPLSNSVGAFHIQQYVQCPGNAAPASAPTTGC